MDLNWVRLSGRSLAWLCAKPRPGTPVRSIHLRRSQSGEYDSNSRRSLPSKSELVDKNTREPRRNGLNGSWLGNQGLDRIGPDVVVRQAVSASCAGGAGSRRFRREPMTTTRSALTRRLLERLTDEEWRVVRTARANVLFMGQGVSAKKVVEALQSQISGPIQVWRPGARLVLPPAEQAGTLVLQELGAMAHDDQRHLHDWLQVSSGHTRVISIAQQPVLPLLEAGTFSDTLYYRLNVLCFQVSPTPTKGARPRPRRIARRAHESERHNGNPWEGCARAPRTRPWRQARDQISLQV